MKYISFLIYDLDNKISAFFKTLDLNLRHFKALKTSFQILDFLRIYKTL